MVAAPITWDLEEIRRRCVETPSGCWEWTGFRNLRGYGITQFRSRQWLAHRLAYLLAKGSPGDLCVCHHCDFPPCCNPDHLFLGDQADNIRDMRRKGRGRTRAKRGSENHMAILTEDQVREIRRLYQPGRGGGGKRPFSCGGLAARYGVTCHAIWRIVKRRTWAHLT